MNTKLKTGLILLMVTGYFTAAFGQADTVVIRVGKESKVTFLIKDKKDLETLKHYNFQALMDDMVKKLEQRDSTTIAKPSSDYLKDTAKTAPSNPSSIDNWERDKNDDDNDDRMSNRQRKKQNRRTHHSVNLDIGTNNYLQGGKFPDATNQQYSVKPWGSWYVGINSIMHTRIAKKLFLDWGGGVSWYNFKFDDPTTVLSKDNNGVNFSKDLRKLDFRKSKLTTTYVNIMAVPMIDFGDNGRKSTFFDDHHSRSFRIGAGPYAGYLIDSYTKQMYYDQGEKVRTHNHDNYYLNNIRYGLRLQVGFRDTDIFFNYDMNELFTENKGPKVQAFSFGITL